MLIPDATPLPIDAHLDAIAGQLTARGGVLVLCAPPGTGKTTRVPGALIDAGVLAGAEQVIVLEPRRLAARAAARRVAKERGGRVGDEVGYIVRHDRAVSARSRIVFVTEGVLVRRLVSDPFLGGVGAVVLDEFHERHLEGDLALAMLAEVRATVRPDLRLIVMSATLELASLGNFLGEAGAPFTVASPLYPVAVVHEQQLDRRPLERRIRAAVDRALAETAGDVLVFLPGRGEIRAAESVLRASLEPGILVAPLHAGLDAAAQDRAIEPQPGRRRVVLATNLAETSLTIEGVTAVVDAGLVRNLRHDAQLGLDVLRLEKISRASATQRQGRAGRTGPGVCYRLWTSGEERGMVAHELPEVRRIDVAGAVLQVHAFSGRSAADFGWFESPPPQALSRADDLLQLLGALDADGALTVVGREMLEQPVHPRLARALVAARAAGCVEAAAGVIALLSERDIAAAEAAAPPIADALELVELLDRLDRDGVSDAACRRAGLIPTVVRAVLRARARLVPRGRRRGDGDRAAAGGAAAALLAGFPDRVARRPQEGAREGVMVGGRGVLLSEEAAAALPGELFLALRTSAHAPGGSRRERSRTRVTLLAPLERSWLDAIAPQHLTVRHLAELDENRGRVVGTRSVEFLGLPLETSRGGSPDPERAAELLQQLLQRDPWRHLAGSVDALRGFVERAAWLRQARPDSGVPELGDREVAAAAAQLCAGRTDLGGLRAADVLHVLRATLPGNAVAAVDRGAPSTLVLPSGRQARVDYSAAAGPTVAAAIQELFGLRDTPTLGAADGVSVVLELLAPNRRPIQITRDLASFWANVYPSARLELGRRYPKHAWPEDPLTAVPTVGPRRRRR